MKINSKVNANDPQHLAPPRDSAFFHERVKNRRLVPYPLGMESNISWSHMNNEKSNIYNGGVLNFSAGNNASDTAHS